jgi:hypothetical protein
MALDLLSFEIENDRRCPSEGRQPAPARVIDLIGLKVGLEASIRPKRAIGMWSTGIDLMIPDEDDSSIFARERCHTVVARRDKETVIHSFSSGGYDAVVKSFG